MISRGDKARGACTAEYINDEFHIPNDDYNAAMTRHETFSSRDQMTISTMLTYQGICGVAQARARSRKTQDPSVVKMRLATTNAFSPASCRYMIRAPPPGVHYECFMTNKSRTIQHNEKEEMATSGHPDTSIREQHDQTPASDCGTWKDMYHVRVSLYSRSTTPSLHTYHDIPFIYLLTNVNTDHCHGDLRFGSTIGPCLILMLKRHFTPGLRIADPKTL